MLGGGVAITLVLALGGFFLLSGGDDSGVNIAVGAADGEPGKVVKNQQNSEDLNAAAKSDNSSSETAAASKPPEEASSNATVSVPSGPARYIEIEPDMIARLQSLDGRNRFVRLKVVFMTRDSEQVEGLTNHIPLFKASIMDVLNAQSYKTLNTPKGKKDLKQAILLKLKALEKEQTQKETIESVLFTNFIME